MADLIRFSSLWPSDSFIRALCAKLNTGFTILELFKEGIVERTRVEDLPSAGSLLLIGDESKRHYTIYDGIFLLSLQDNKIK